MVPETPLGFVMAIEVMAVPEQIVWVVGVPATVGVGYTLKITLKVEPIQVPLLAVTV